MSTAPYLSGVTSSHPPDLHHESRSPVPRLAWINQRRKARANIWFILMYILLSLISLSPLLCIFISYNNYVNFHCRHGNVIEHLLAFKCLVSIIHLYIFAYIILNSWKLYLKYTRCLSTILLVTLDYGISLITVAKKIIIICLFPFRIEIYLCYVSTMIERCYSYFFNSPLMPLMLCILYFPPHNRPLFFSYCPVSISPWLCLIYV
jgi:hypothetical protein